MLELGKQNATAIYPTRDIIRTDGKIVHSHHAKPGDCLQHNLVGRAGRSLSCCVIWVLDFWLSIQKLLAFAPTTVNYNTSEKYRVTTQGSFAERLYIISEICKL